MPVVGFDRRRTEPCIGHLLNPADIYSGMTDENKFCVVCGANLPSGAEFCPACGSKVDGGVNPYARGPDTMYRAPRKSNQTVSILIGIYGILALLVGAYGLYSGLTYNEYEYNQIVDVYESLGIFLDLSLEDMKSQLILSGALSLASGVLALVCFLMCARGGPWKVAVVVCLIASVLSYGFLSFVSIAIGLVVTYLLYSNRSAFDH